MIFQFLDNKLATEKESSKKCTMGTSTELSYANTEVQTMPCDINEPSESEWNDEPIENLSVRKPFSWTANFLMKDK